MTAPAGEQAPRARAQRYRVGTRMLVWLVAGRSTYRLVTLVTTVLLLPVWGEQRYRGYAAAMAAFSWLLVLVFTGPEKTVLKLLPRAPRTGQQVTDAIVATAWWLPLPLAAAFGLALLAAGPGTAALYLGVAAMLLSIGCTQLLVGLHRAHGQPRADVRAFVTMSAGQLLLLAGAAAGYLGPVGFVAAMTLLQLAVNLVLSATLGRPSLRIRHRAGFLRRLGWTALLLSGADLFLFLSTAVLFTVLAGSAHASQLSLLYPVLLVWSAGVNLLLYLFRVFTPRTALRLAGRGTPAGRARAARLAGAVALADLGWLATAGVLLVTTGLACTTSTTGQLLLWAVLLATRAPALAGMLRASFLLENTDATAPRVVGAAAATGLVTATAVGLATVPALGAVGVIGAVCVGELGCALVIAYGAGRRAGAVRPGDGVGPSGPGRFAAALLPSRSWKRPIAESGSRSLPGG